jgi:adenylate kinase
MRLAHIATGDMFREAQKKGTPLGLQAKDYMEKGKLVPDKITVAMLLERLAAPDCERGVIFDGFPRTLAQAEALDKALAKQKKAIDRVIYIKVAEEELVKRLGGRWICRQCQSPYHELTASPKVKGRCDKCGGELYQRDDDKPATVKERLKVYFAQTAPLINYYEKTGKLVEVEGTGAVEEIRKRIMSTLNKGVAGRRQA